MDFFEKLYKSCSCFSSKENTHDEERVTLDFDILPPNTKSNYKPYNTESLESQILETFTSPVAVQEAYLVEEKFIRPEENWINFTKTGLLNFLEEIVVDKEWTPLYNQTGLTMFFTGASKLTSGFLLGKTRMTIKKSSFISPISLEFLKTHVILIFVILVV